VHDIDLACFYIEYSNPKKLKMHDKTYYFKRKNKFMHDENFSLLGTELARTGTSRGHGSPNFLFLFLFLY
jgi:hypothetical protein